MTEEVIAANARVAAELGIRVVTVDAGWFGAPDAGSDWQEQRGDWDRVNTARFPSGLAALGRSVRAAGAEPGIWIEAEAVAGPRLRQQRPEALARADGRRRDPSYRVTTVSLDEDDPGFLGYVCLGSEAGRDHVRSALRDVVAAVGARWVKLDFNIDPDGGCKRTDHGHGRGDGLLRHYQGLYAVLREFRETHPEVILEACASGGLRLDLGLAREVHGFFLSDPDYTEHHLQVLHGAAHLLPSSGSCTGRSRSGGATIRRSSSIGRGSPPRRSTRCCAGHAAPLRGEPASHRAARGSADPAGRARAHVPRRHRADARRRRPRAAHRRAAARRPGGARPRFQLSSVRTDATCSPRSSSPGASGRGVLAGLDPAQEYV